MTDRALNILRHVVVPVALAAISGYVAVQTSREQTKMSYEKLAPLVGDLQDQIVKLQGRVEELSKTTRVIVMRETPMAPWDAKAKPTKPSAGSGLGAIGTGESHVTVEKVAPPQSQKRPPAKFDDMLKGM